MLSEQQIFDKLSELCAQKGFIHTLANIWFQDNYYMANSSGNFTTSQIVKMNADRSKLHRNELNTLLALLIKNNPKFFNDEKPNTKVLEQHSHEAYELLGSFHNIFKQRMLENIFDKIQLMEKDNSLKIPESEVFINTNSIREAIFYSGDGVYDFQYQDLGYVKYLNDNAWFFENKGFSLQNACFIIETIYYMHHEKINNLIENQETISLKKFSYSKNEIFTFLKKQFELNQETDLAIDEIMSFISSFSFDSNNLNDLIGFQSFDDFNPLVAFPIIKLSEDEFLLFDIYSLHQAFYETPFFWLNGDEKYKNIASNNRGKFTENMIYTIFSNIFGKENVWLNVDLYSKSSLTHSIKDKIGEIDVLVNLHGYALVFQAKSKKLTLNARKGNIKQIDDDFSKSIQSAYNQAFECSEILLSNNYIAKINEEIIRLPETVYCMPICILSEHFPALTMQIRWFLHEKVHQNISKALVFDVFLLDLMYKTLNTRLEFLHFIHSLSVAREKFLSNTQIDLLAIHLSRNLLCLEEDFHMFYLDNGFSADLDLFLMQNRRNIIIQRHKELPPLSCWYRFQDTYWWQLFDYCSDLSTKEKLKFGLELLQCSEEFIENYNTIVSQQITQFKKDVTRDIAAFSTCLTNKSGITVHMRNSPFITSKIKNEVINHARLRKYNFKSDLWFAIIITTQGIVKYIHILDDTWEFNLDTQKEYQNTLGTTSKQKFFQNGIIKTKKIGRNEPCPCNSGKKYKHCCLNRR